MYQLGLSAGAQDITMCRSFGTELNEIFDGVIYYIRSKAGLSF